MASTASFRRSEVTMLPIASMKVDLPAPGTPVMPMRTDRLAWGRQRSMISLRLRIMVGVAAFDERDGPRQRSNVTLQDALHILLGRETVFLLTNEIRVDDRLIGDAFRYGKGRIVMMVDILFS